MDFSLSEDQEALRAAVTDFARRELDDDVVERDYDGRFSRDRLAEMRGSGAARTAVRREYGGAGADIVTTMLALEALGYGCRTTA